MNTFKLNDTMLTCIRFHCFSFAQSVLLEMPSVLMYCVTSI